ncbi:MAG: PAS domain-containing protein, partial [Gemmatimonadota bacterium]|nr:PAS domain-containing protein [Gemmatimonadota bacterium]
MRALLDLLPFPAAIVRKSDGLILVVNEAGGEFLGLPAGEVVGRTTDFFYAGAQPREERLRVLLEGNGQTRRETPIRLPSGETRWVDLLARPMVHDGAEAFFVCGTDVTDRHESISALESFDAELAFLMDAIPDPVIVVDGTGTVV